MFAAFERYLKAILNADFKAVFICSIKSCLDTNLEGVLQGDLESCFFANCFASGFVIKHDFVAVFVTL